MKKDNKIANNIAIIQYELEDGRIKIVMLKRNDVRELKKIVGIHIGNKKKVLSVQFYWNLDNKKINEFEEGTIYE